MHILKNARRNTIKFNNTKVLQTENVYENTLLRSYTNLGIHLYINFSRRVTTKNISEGQKPKELPGFFSKEFFSFSGLLMCFFVVALLLKFIIKLRYPNDVSFVYIQNNKNQCLQHQMGDFQYEDR